MTSTHCPLPLVALRGDETCPRCGRPAREHRGHPAYEEETMTETTEPTREKIEKRIAQLEGLLRGPESAVGRETDLAVYRMALRTLDAEAKLAAMTERAEKAERERDVAREALHDIVSELRDALGDFPKLGKWTGAVKRMRTKLSEAERRIAAKRRRAPRSTFESLRTKIAAMHRRAQRAESATATARREAIGQRKRADWWRGKAKQIEVERAEEHAAIVRDAKHHGPLDAERAARLRYAVGLLTERASEAEERARTAQHDLESVQRQNSDMRAENARLREAMPTLKELYALVRVCDQWIPSHVRHDEKTLRGWLARLDAARKGGA